MAAPKKIKIEIVLPVQARFELDNFPGDIIEVRKKLADQIIAAGYAIKSK